MNKSKGKKEEKWKADFKDYYAGRMKEYDCCSGYSAGVPCCGCGGVTLAESLESAISGWIEKAQKEAEQKVKDIIESYKKHSTHNSTDTCLEEIIKEI